MKNTNNPDSEIARLANDILLHKKRYYDGEPIIPDEAYDALEDKLRKLDPNHPFLHIVGSSETGKITHDSPMLSCQKATSVDEVIKWSEGRELAVGYKIDGFSLSLTYQGGHLIQAATRGNGTTGDDSTLVAMKIHTIPKTIPITKRVNIRGELYMRVSEFHRINKEESETYSSPRNLAVGTIKQKDLTLLDKRVLEFSAFELIGYQDDESLTKQQITLTNWGFETTEFGLVKKEQDIENIYTQKTKERPTLDFEIDGLVFKFNNANERYEAGSTAHHPKWMIALKFPSKGKPSEIQDITWQVGRMGYLTPVAELTPVQVMGAEIRRATLHNAEFMETLDIASGDKVMVIRSGDIIPKVTEIVQKGTNTAQFPTSCPSCASPLQREGVNLVCTGETCRDREIQQIHHWVKITDIKGLGPKSITSAYDAGIIKHYADLYTVTESKWVSLLGKNGKKVYQNIKETRMIPFPIFLAGLGIETLGKEMAKILARHFATFEELKQAKINQLVEIDRISDITASKIFKGLHDPSLAERVLQNGVEIVYTSKRKKKHLHPSPTLMDHFGGSTQTKSPQPSTVNTVELEEYPKVYVTGKIPELSKKQVQELVEENNFEWASISKQLDFLIVGENPGQSKLEKAEKYGIPIKSWKAFKKEFNIK